ncbi:MAG: hypothetical protein NT150_13920 [Bacteroidetes bacterium]|jgi:hypothetical protein|nr:hypothetical protein [Bacteroidota bacterium]
MIKYILIFSVSSIIFFSCTKTVIDDNNNSKTDVCSTPDTISFSKNIQPIFNKSCSNLGCHSGNNPPGGLNLENTKSLNSLKGGGYINLGDPKSSIVYASMTSNTAPMPTSGKLDTCTTKLVLKWIQQGAKNN